MDFLLMLPDRRRVVIELDGFSASLFRTANTPG